MFDLGEMGINRDLEIDLFFDLAQTGTGGILAGLYFASRKLPQPAQ